MIQIRRSAERGHADHGWLKSYHTFSFADYHDPEHMGLGPLRVINEDRVQPGRGFDTHGHRDMEIISYVLEGALAHKDSMGNGSVIRPGDVQRMSAGTGVQHSEFNDSIADLVHFLQVWIVPEQQGSAPGYEQKNFSAEERRGNLRLIGSRNGRNGSVIIHQDCDLYSALLSDGDVVSRALAPGRRAWIQVARGSVVVNGKRLDTGDGAAIVKEVDITVRASAEAEILLFDMA